jgi:NADH-quinone oxidoreductase subunit J
MTTRDIVFICFAVLAAGCALLAVTTKQVVHAALWLVATLGTIAGCYFVLGAELVGLVQLLIYVGAVIILVIFALMLTRAPIGKHDDLATPGWQRAVAAVVGASLAALIAAVVLPVVTDAAVDIPASTNKGVSAAIFGVWVWPFELLSVLLLSALIGAFIVSQVVRAAGRPTGGEGR